MENLTPSELSASVVMPKIELALDELRAIIAAAWAYRVGADWTLRLETLADQLADIGRP